MRKTVARNLFLAVLGLFIGQGLAGLFSKQPEKILQVGEDLVAARMSVDGSHLAGVGKRQSGWFLQVWNRRGREVVRALDLPKPPGRYPAFDWSPDGREVAVAATDKVWIVDLKDGKRTELQAGPEIRAVEYRGRLLMARTRTATVLWEEGKPVWRLDQNYLLHSALSEDGTLLATSCFDDGVRVFDIRRKREVDHYAPGHLSSGLKFGAGGKLLTSGFRYRGDRRQDQIVTFEISSGRPVGPSLSTPTLYGFDLTPDGARVVSRQASGAALWDTKTGAVLGRRSEPSRLLDVISPDGRHVCSERGAGLACVWTSRGSDPEYALRCPRPLTDMNFPRSDEVLVVGGQASLWKLP